MEARCRAVVLGVLEDGLDSLGATQREWLQTADLVIGGRRVLDLVGTAIPVTANRFDLTGRLKEVPERIERALAQGKRVVVLATGDPLCHGIGGWLVRKLGEKRLTVVPHLSAVQLACARLGISWHDARICSVHGPDGGEWTEETRGTNHALYPVFRAAMEAEKIVAFTSPENHPGRIARLLLHEGWQDRFEMAVCEALGSCRERVQRGSVETFRDWRGEAMTMVVLLARARVTQRPMFGINDDAFVQRKPDKGLITKCEVRAVSLALLGLGHDSIVWEIGAGSGAVGLEAARLCPDGWVYAIEKNGADVAIARENRQRFAVRNHSLIHGRAPDGLERWPDPDAIFIGGSGGELAELIRVAMARLRPGGRLVMNFVTLENLNTAVETLKALDVAWTVRQLQVARSAPILRMHRMRAENPVWVVTAEAACADD